MFKFILIFLNTLAHINQKIKDKLVVYLIEKEFTSFKKKYDALLKDSYIGTPHYSSDGMYFVDLYNIEMKNTSSISDLFADHFQAFNERYKEYVCPIFYTPEQTKELTRLKPFK